MIENENKVKRKIQLRPVTVKHQEISLPKEIIEKAEAAEAKEAVEEESNLSADQLAILFVCQRGHQSFISVLQGVNSTRIPVGKKPLREAEVRALLDDLETQGYLKKAEIHDQPTWAATEKARALET
ncbi:MAG: hypothetical protein ACFFCF_01130 [Promethearchaeota archaeon]